MFLNALYLTLVLAASPVLFYRAVRHGKYRQGWRAKWLGATSLPPSSRPRIWLHAVSVGEVNLLKGMVAQWEAQYPGHELVVSTTTVTGFELARKHFGEAQVFYCPLDLTWAVRRACREVRPAILVLAELEVWPNLIATVSKQGVPVAVINGRLSERSFRGYRKVRWVIGRTFRRLALVACQDATYAQRFIELGVTPSAVQITGSLKFDDAPTDRQTPAAMACADLAGLRPWHRVWVAGSTQAGEEAIVLRVYQMLRQQHPELRLVLVPRHQERFDACAGLVQAAGLQCVRRTKVQDGQASPPLAAECVFLVDTIGELRDWWATAQIAFVGGSLGSRGGQNMLEPAGYGAAVCFGPNTRNFRDIVTHLLQAEAAVEVTDETALADFVRRCLIDIPSAERLGMAAQRVVAAHRGATNKTMHALSGLLGRPAKRTAA